MVSIASLWLPILVAALVVFFASSVFHMMLPWHQKDYDKLPDEEKTLEALRGSGVGVGNYMFPHCTGKEMANEEMQEKWKRGPVGFLNVLPSGVPAMGKQLGLWFVYCVIVGVFVAYIAGLSLAPGAHYLKVFQIVGATGFIAYGLGAPLESIWRGQKWGTSLRFLVDGLVYGALTAGVFGWLWPAAA